MEQNFRGPFKGNGTKDLHPYAMHLEFGVGKYTKLYTVPKIEAHLFFTPKG